ncbi:ABC transporter ATP-binding protein [Hyphomicrobium sp.]|jgi:NitT/TauT family transport system ATP-binding protein|uniref:ABC transporter ATP-binding protein n=1 Tax=Hyphomicrobium sp. TaxID=82 RepID=UPI002CB8444E|nr:ABC transporter ATP-binding protein [Hyphomicrobium sp.]HVZ05027.1 ABC transporter ATP-binding protein [Hyphomicrobium sp.]
MNAIVFDKVWKEYGDHVVLEQIDLEIAPRSFVALVGPSGCGKTTFLKMLLGEEQPTRGYIEVGGAPLKPEPDSDRGVVFQRYSVFPHLTVLDNVVIGREFEKGGALGKLFGAKRRQAERDGQELLDAVGLSGHENKYPSALSGGMQQRLALAQALMRRPKILLLDEPFGALDPGIRADIHVLMRRIWNESELTIVMVTHDLREAFELGTRIIAFERPRNRPEEAERYGSRLSADIPQPLDMPTTPRGATVTKDFEIWPKKVAGSDVWIRHNAGTPRS